MVNFTSLGQFVLDMIYILKLTSNSWVIPISNFKNFNFFFWNMFLIQHYLLGSQFYELPWPKNINFLHKMSTPILNCCKFSPKNKFMYTHLYKQSWCSYWCSSSYLNIPTMLPSWSIVTLHVLSNCISYLSHMFCPKGMHVFRT